MSAARIKCGERLRATREALGHDEQKTFAEEFGIKPSRYRNWERGEHFPPPDFLIALKRAYGIPSDWLLDGELAALPKALAPKVFERLKQPRGGAA